MSHAHRDENQLLEPEVAEPAAVVPVVPAPSVANSEAARRAEERRKADGSLAQTAAHQFTGDLPEPDRGGGTEIELRITRGGEDDDDNVDAGSPVLRHRGPPPPRFVQYQDDASWAAPSLLQLATGWLTGGRVPWIR